MGIRRTRERTAVVVVVVPTSATQNNNDHHMHALIQLFVFIFYLGHNSQKLFLLIFMVIYGNSLLYVYLEQMKALKREPFILVNKI